MLYEKYRPKTFDEVLGQDKAIRKIQRRLGKKPERLAYWISGKSGTGKTTIARIIASQLADNWDTEEIDAAKLTPAKINELKNRWMLTTMRPGGYHALIVDEAHGLRKDTIRRLLVWLEELPIRSCVIFTTTNAGQSSLFDDHIDTGPLLSRCSQVKLTGEGINPLFAARAKEIAEAEGLDGQPLEKYKRLVKNCKGNMRMVLQEIEDGEMLE